MAQLMFEHIPRRILVTGGGTGIGLGIVKRLRELDCGVVAVGRRLQPLEQAAHFGAEVQQWDITSNQAELLRRIGPVDGLVLNAGQFIYEPVSAWTESAWTQLWRVNTLAAAMLAHEFSEQLDGPGAIVAVASTLAHRPAPGAAPYAASKAALVATIQHLALELAPRGIRANVVSPGVVPTEMTEADRGGEAVDEQRAAFLALHPIGRLGEPRDVADTVVHALSNPWMTGANLNIDGGLLVRE